MHSLLTALPWSIAGLCFCSCLLAAIYARRAMIYARDCTHWLEENNKRSRTLKQLTAIETELTEHTDSIKAIHDSMHKLRSRIHMRDVNDKKKTPNIDEIPDPTKDPEGWKRAMRLKLRLNQAE